MFQIFTFLFETPFLRYKKVYLKTFYSKIVLDPNQIFYQLQTPTKTGLSTNPPSNWEKRKLVSVRYRNTDMSGLSPGNGQCQIRFWLNIYKVALTFTTITLTQGLYFLTLFLMASVRLIISLIMLTHLNWRWVVAKHYKPQLNVITF